ncbi:MAG: 1,2-phenylacetyl-CoA epoxidase subunit PaaD [Ornithinimicrobium sp.]|uniref:1,2-phenylacetyl-CoA epoxidase subunit PaaD n=1 Tax=Ornithinimicrobium sp. TaxID=1977084 RepID=UPI0017F01D9F|nr:phenylacetate-CoA oxygenase subunit PaaJ [Actinomycetota bacterium]
MSPTTTRRAGVETDALEAAIRAIPDPEIPVISIDDLGIVRGLELLERRGGDERAVVRVTITPTYSGCPAMGVITETIEAEVRRAGLTPQVVTRLSPAWTTDWMSPQGKVSLRRFGIAPPTGRAAVRSEGPVVVDLRVRSVTCPQCGAADTEELARFGATACKALRRCLECREPFEEFKPI